MMYAYELCGNQQRVHQMEKFGRLFISDPKAHRLHARNADCNHDCYVMLALSIDCQSWTPPCAYPSSESSVFQCFVPGSETLESA